jgi:hypothetical protein
LTIKLSTTMSRTAAPMGAWNDMRPEALCRSGVGEAGQSRKIGGLASGRDCKKRKVILAAAQHFNCTM